MSKPKRHLKSYRFWVYWNGGPIKLTLTAENTESNNISFGRVEKTDEGWDSEARFYWVEESLGEYGIGVYVHSTIHTDGRDWDGRLSQTYSSSCPTHRLQSRYPDPECTELYGILWPEWKETARKQRDYSAEAANY